MSRMPSQRQSARARPRPEKAEEEASSK
jgi:hypothetical protein